MCGGFENNYAEDMCSNVISDYMEYEDILIIGGGDL